MKVAYTTLLIILVTLLLVSGCSEEKPGTPESKNVVRKEIKKPLKATNNWKETQKEIADIVDKDIEHRINQETTKKPAIPEEEENTYVTKEGDSLSDIAGKQDIYDNPLKWPFIYRDNREILSSIKDKDNLFEASLPAGIRLKIMPQEEIEKNLANRQGNYFVANIISSPYLKEIAPQAVKLLDEGYAAYISSANVDGKEWYRLRTGFYKTRSEANGEGDKIKKILKITDIWTAKIGDEEFHDFGGY